MNNIVVIGELGIDRFIYGRIDRLSPEAPVPVLIPIEKTENPGMAGNVVKNLEALSDNKVTHYHQEEIITKTRYVEKKTNHMFLRVDDGELNRCSKYDNTNIELSEYDATIISDYDKGFVSHDDIVEIAKQSKISILDSKKKLDAKTVQYLDFIKLNESEAYLNKDIVTLFPDKFIITLGARGVQYNNKMYPSPNPQETIDVSGAGDTFVASFIKEYLSTRDVPSSIKYANEMASIVVSMRGVNTPV